MSNDDYLRLAKIEYTYKKRQYEAVESYLDLQKGKLDYNSYGRLCRVKAELKESMSNLESIIKKK